ncbi:oxidoreductase, partial [Bacillus spizizenii]|nr:oxidoreductase [Bacillus spizizenii]
MMLVKVLAPAMTETEFLKIATDTKEFFYKAIIPLYHTVEQVASFMMELYDRYKVVGVVDENYEHQLVNHIYPILEA